MKRVSATASPYAPKVCVALAEREFRSEVPWNDDTQTPRYNPLEKLPILVMDDGSSIHESHFILEYLEMKHPTRRYCRALTTTSSRPSAFRSLVTTDRTRWPKRCRR